MELKEIISHMKNAIDKGELKLVSAEGHRYYTDVLETVHIPVTTPEETARLYERLVINQTAINNNKQSDLFASLPRVSLFVGQPDTGKTYQAEMIAKDCGITPLFKMCRDNLNLETLLEDFQLEDGKPAFKESLAIKMMSGNERHLIIFDEFNTLLTGVMKTFQPLFDSTSSTFEYRGKIYNKNLNCKFILTLNDKDKGISVIPDAILSRSKLKWFDPVPTSTVALWTGVPIEWVNNLFKVYKALNLLNVFGTRQVKMLYGSSVSDIKNHLYGLLKIKNLDEKTVDTLEVLQFINKL